MTTPNTDRIEEDTADFQFSKDWASSSKHYNKLKMPSKRKDILIMDSNCFVCKCIISEPYVHCATCNNVMLCAMCFANGKEKLCHKNDHDYMIIQNDFPLIEGSGWTAREVKSLLDSLQECGFGNWEGISNKLMVKSAEECKQYYLQNFVKTQKLPGLPKFKYSLTSLLGHEPTPFMLALENNEDPPRFLPGSLNSKLMGGYNAARSDFDINFDNHAESKVAKLNYDSFTTNNESFELGQSLQIAIFQAYNTRLKERARRQKIIRDHGLISTRKLISSLLKYDYTITRPLVERLRIFSQVLNGIEFDSIMECLHQIGELKNNLKQLYLYRQNGLTSFYSVPVFEELCKLQQKYSKEEKQFVSNTNCQWQKLISPSPNNNVPSTNLSKRREAPPLHIHSGMEEYDKLDDSERNLCSVVRIEPKKFIEMKHLLISENKRCGSVKLAQARHLLKIDVNKTKKIFDFLAQQNHILIN